MTLDPKDWSAFRKAAHDMLDASLDKLENAREGKVWTPVTESLAKKLKEPLPMGPMDYEQISDSLKEIMPYGPGNIHPRFFGWVNGAGSPSNILAEMAGASMNVNAGSRNHVAPHIEQQVIRWMADIMGMLKPPTLTPVWLAMRASKPIAVLAAPLICWGFAKTIFEK